MRIFLLAVTFFVFAAATTFTLADPLPSWKDNATKSRIVDFVTAVTNPASDQFVPESERIATFDNDGTLWAEQPLYFQLFFAIDRLKTLSETDPSILESNVLKAAINGDMKTVAASGNEGLLEIISRSHSGLSVEDFISEVQDWLETAKHPKTGMAYDEMIYQPMLELLSYLRDKGFTTYITSGGGIHFIRAFAEEAYNIPPQQVIGSTGKSSYKIVDGVPVIMKDPGIAFIDDKAGKPVAIDSRLGRKPIFVGGNSDGDFEMLEWATSAEGPSLGLIVHHTDAKREFKYDRDGHIGTLDKGLDEASQRGWLIVDMANDWEQVWP